MTKIAAKSWGVATLDGIKCLKACLRVCRYRQGSEMCERLAKALDHLTSSEERELFDYGSRPGEASPLVLLLDRCAALAIVPPVHWPLTNSA